MKGKLRGYIRYFFNNISEKHRVSVENPTNGEELWYMLISPLNLIAGFGGFIIVMFIIIATTVAYTPILDLIPGYPGNKSRNILIENILRLDSMENELIKWNQYYDNLATIMQGRAPMSKLDAPADSTLGSKPTDIEKIEEDSILRMQMELNEIYKSGESSDVMRLSTNVTGLFSPVKGKIINAYNPKKGNLGVTVTSLPNEPVMAVMSGSVILATWSPELGYVMYIQHPDNFVSVYKHNHQLIKSVGERVNAGDVIGYTGSADKESGKLNSLVFELWYNGTPVDPTKYIIF